MDGWMYGLMNGCTESIHCAGLPPLDMFKPQLGLIASRFGMIKPTIGIIQFQWESFSHNWAFEP